VKRNVPLRFDGKRVLFVGDSFTEGIGLPYEQTFVGRFASANRQLDVLNAGVSYYSPSGYYAKIKYLLGTGLRVDEVVVYIDISDIQEEATRFRNDTEGRLEEGDFNEGCTSPTQMVRSELPWWARFSYTMDFFYKRHIASKLARYVPTMEVAALVQPGGIYARDLAIGSWTYDADAPCYGRLGIEGAIAKALAEMDKLQGLLAARDIPLSVGVYPWPQQLLDDHEKSTVEPPRCAVIARRP
jgi:hypothetical protein